MRMATLVLILAACGAGWTANAQTPSANSTSEIVVTTPRGRTSGGIDPMVEISPSELDSYGADTLSDLVDALRPLTRSSRSDQTAVVLINGHLAGQMEFDNLPREAIERVEVLSESVALQYGRCRRLGPRRGSTAGCERHRTHGAPPRHQIPLTFLLWELRIFACSSTSVACH
jgi:hypothetical protein